MTVFINNEQKPTKLKSRLHQLIQHASQLKFLVGFFYFSGWAELVAAIQQRPDLHIKILVGLDVDIMLDRVLEVALPSDELSHADLADRFRASLAIALNDEELDRADFYAQVNCFLDLLEQERLHIRKTLRPNHAKLYFFKADESLQGWLAPGQSGKFITGSSNLTRAGLGGQDEFNVEISDYGTHEAENYFDGLWASAVNLTPDPQARSALARLVRSRTQIAPIEPFEAYVLVLKTYLDLMEQKRIHQFVTLLLEEGGYTSYQYQLDAVSQALGIIQQYNGAIIADVVGLGKTLIACMIARDLGKRGMVICPPGLMGDPHYQTGWRKYLADFELRKYEWEVFSCGDLENAAEYVQGDGRDIEVIIVDEAHRFRNEDTQSYEYLSAICRNRQVILLTATPFNNSPADIFAMLKLFIVPGRSALTLDENLEGRFARYNRDFQRLSFITRYHAAGGDKQKRAEKYYQEMFDRPLPIQIDLVVARTRQLAAHIRAVLEPVLIRRNRLDLRQDPVYSREVTDLPEVRDPCELFYALTSEQLDFYDRVVNEYFGEDGRFSGAIYQPFSYEKNRAVQEELLDEEGNRVYQQQRNLYDFMRRLVVKRFESSFGAFARTISNFERVHQIVLEFITASGGRYILDRQLIEKIYQEDADEIEAALEQFAARLSEQKRLPRHERIYTIADFEQGEQFMAHIQADLELISDIKHQLEELGLLANDSKAACLIKEITEMLNAPQNPGEPRRKVVIFSEYVDTVNHLQPMLEEAFPGRVLVVAGGLPPGLSRDILHNFDASDKADQQADDYDILLTSDKLSEGVNLNRAGAVINYDIPWNPTRVIQRVGRINRIGKKVFQELHIYNFFPTEQGADIIKSREIAEQKMFLIHTTLGEDAKIFNADETPAPAELYHRINRNPEQDEEESLFTRIRREYFRIKEEHPELIEKISNYPARVKTAKQAEKNQLVVFRRKGLGLFIQAVEDTHIEKPEVAPLLMENGLELIRCIPDEPRLPLSPRFWPAYEAIKSHREVFRMPRSEIALDTKALNNLTSAIHHYAEQLEEWLPFLRMLVKDLREYLTLPKFTLRRLASVNMEGGHPERVDDFIKELAAVRRFIGGDYLEEIERRASTVKTEVIIAVENQEKI